MSQTNYRTVDLAIASAIRLHIGAEVPPGANFFEEGLNSRVIVSVHATVRALLRREVPLVAFFKYPTRRALARYLSRELNDREPARIADGPQSHIEWSTQARRDLRARIWRRGT